MSGFDNAKKVATTIDLVGHWSDIEDLVATDAPFDCQAPALKDVTTVKGWYDWMTNFNANIAPGCKPTNVIFAYDEDSNTCLMDATYTATHTGDGGPVPATNKSTATHYCYRIKMNADKKVESMTKIWNDGFCLSELGWA